MVRRYGKSEKSEECRRRDDDPPSRLQSGAAVLIVIASVLSALAVLVGAVYDEHGSQKDAEYRQQMVDRERVERSQEEEVNHDVALFGGFEQHVLHARDLQSAAGAFDAQPRLATALRSRAERERALAADLIDDFQVIKPVANSTGLEYDPSRAYRFAGETLTALGEDINPRPLRRDARADRHRSVWANGIAALFLAAAVLLTFAQVRAARRDSTHARDDSSGPATAAGGSPRAARATFAGGFGALMAGLVLLFVHASPLVLLPG